MRIFAAVIGVFLLGFGALSDLVLGQDYAACQSPWVDSGQMACGIASAAHGYGILAMIVGAMVLTLVIIVTTITGGARDHRR